MNWTKVKAWILEHPRWVAWLVSVVLGVALALPKGEKPVIPPMPLDEPLIVNATGDVDSDRAIEDAKGSGRRVYTTGWKKDPDAVAAVQSTLPFRVFGDTPAGKVVGIPDHVYLWEAYSKLPIRGPPSKDQGEFGTCVGFGTINGVERTIAAAIANGKAEQFKLLAEEVVYAGSRVEIGGGKIRGDGSVGAWAAKWVKDYGIVVREIHGKHDLTKYSGTRAREWGRTGVPNELEPLAREHPVKETTLVRDWNEAKKALASGYGISVCSDQGFTMQRDSRGVARASGSWAHCMCLDGYHVDADGREYGHIENSWGPDAHTGPTGWGNPPTSGFWAESRVIDRMIRGGGDTWAFSDVKGFPARKLDWFVQTNPPRRMGPDVRPLFALAP